MLGFKSSLSAISSERGSERDGIAAISAFVNHNGVTGSFPKPYEEALGILISVGN